MPAYVISDVKSRDRSAVESYRPRAAASIAQYGGAIRSAAERSKRSKGGGARTRLSSSSFQAWSARGPGIAPANMPPRS